MRRGARLEILPTSLWGHLGATDNQCIVILKYTVPQILLKIV